MSIPLVNAKSPVTLIKEMNLILSRKILEAKNSVLLMGNSNVVAAPPAAISSEKLGSTLALGAGCYWGTEKYVRVDFQKKFPGAIKSCSVGFMAPKDPEPQFRNPTYQQVCSGASGHIEVLFVELAEPETHFEELIRFFFQFHDPTTKNRQGFDSGFQYASWIFCEDEAQSRIANTVRDELQKAIEQRKVKCFKTKEIKTKISPLTKYTEAQSEHQEYLAKNPSGYCNHRIRIDSWPAIKR